MGVEIRYAVSVCLALCASAAGLALFRAGSWAVENQGLEDAQKENKKQQPFIRKAAASQKIWQTGMCACSLILSFFLTAVYDAGLLEVLRIVFLCIVLWVCAWTDIRAYLIPNKILLAGLLAFFVLFAAEAILNPGSVKYAALSSGVSAAALLAAGLLCRLAVPGSVGFGDLKLFVIIGLYLGAENTWNAVFYTLLASFIVSVSLLVSKRASRKSVLPFAPFLLFGTLLSAFLNGV